MNKKRVGLILGAGGVVGLAYHIGTLWGLKEIGFNIDEVDLVVGTSAGAIAGAYLRTGNDPQELFDKYFSNGASFPKVMEFNSSSLPSTIGRTVGSTYLFYQSISRFKLPVFPHYIRSVFPSGMFSVERGRAIIEQGLGEKWPKKPLWLITKDLTTNKMVVIGRDSGCKIGLSDAVNASSAIPGIYPPLRVGHKLLVDGGVFSSTNANVLLGEKIDLALVVAPMCYSEYDPPGKFSRIVRNWPQSRLNAELLELQNAGISVRVIAPRAREVEIHGANLMNSHRLPEIVQSAKLQVKSQARNLFDAIDMTAA